MKSITSHHGSIPSKNLKIETDENSGRPSSSYRIYDPAGNHLLTTVNFQVGPEFNCCHNGASDAALLAIVLDHIKCSNPKESKVSYHLTEAIKSLSLS